MICPGKWCYPSRPRPTGFRGNKGNTQCYGLAVKPVSLNIAGEHHQGENLCRCHAPIPTDESGPELHGDLRIEADPLPDVRRLEHVVGLLGEGTSQPTFPGERKSSFWPFQQKARETWANGVNQKRFIAGIRLLPVPSSSDRKFHDTVLEERRSQFKLI